MKKYFYIFILFFIQATVLSCTDEEIYESPTDGKSSIKITLNVPVDNGKTRGLIYGPDEVPVDGESEIKDIYVLAFDKESKSYLGKFQSYIMLNFRSKYIGRYDSLDDAARARKSAEFLYGFHPQPRTIKIPPMLK